MITRREAVKYLIVVGGTASFLPSCFTEDDKPSVALKNLSLSGSDEKLLAEIEETIIPATNTPGAKALSTHLFTLKMLDDCFEKDAQQKFTKGLKEINSITKKKFDKNFIDCTKQQREELLTDIEQKKNYSDDVSQFYSMAKYLTIEGYMTSKYVMTNLVIYELVPGRFHGSYPVSKT